VTQNARSRSALCRLPALRTWLWLVRPDTVEVASADGFILFHRVSALLDAFGKEFTGGG
jgi:hypothetical protein